ncbi:ABC transporter permease subunit [Rhodoferax sp.]|uniref:ABC transporter permease n=1 Tax=Rhodoferax sp. TaxID=50421 RepID=UPI002634E18E|nr:ABC transporter permease subunit [Rhodoferax sp.]MDD2918540.1 ABC transporter permease subunit [Rhodoferax sp.]
MAEALRLTLNRGRWLAFAPVALIFGPLLPGLFWALAPALGAPVWLDLWADAQWPQALRATLVSSLLGSALALIMAMLLASWHYPGTLWLTLQRRLPLLLALPHAAFAVGLFFLLAPSGWLARLVAQLVHWTSPPDWVTVQDPYGLSLALALAIKESWFLLWVLAALLGEQPVRRQMVLARSLGYSRAQAWRLILWPQLLPRLGWPLAAVLAYGLSVVDMAIILGPNTPPTLAVLVWRWLTDPDAAMQARGSAASLVLLALLLLAAVLARGFWHWRERRRPDPDGLRKAPAARPGLKLHIPLFLTGYAVLAVLLIWSFAETWFFPALWPDSLSWQSWLTADWAPFWTTLWLAAAASLLCLPAALVWLEWGPQRLNAALYLPLIVPAMPLVAAQYAALLNLRLDGTAAGLVWSHLLWVLPYMVLTLVGAYRAFDARLLVSARALGCTRLQACLRVKWPLLARPILATFAVGFAVSVAQYLPTQFAGGGRFVTVTTEAVALSAGGNRRVLAVQALLQIALPVAAFAMAAWMPYWLARHRKGLR